MLTVSVFANSLEIQCQNKLTEKFLEEFDDFYLQQCQSYGDKKWYKATIIEYAIRLNCQNEPNYHIRYDDDDDDEWIHLYQKNVIIL